MIKKHLIVLILKILETCSDEKNPLTQIQITNMISDKYPCDRKTVGRNIKFLKDMGYPIVKTPTGFYMDNQMFSREEIDFVLESVKKSSTEKFDTNDLCQKLSSSLRRYYKT